MSADELIEKIEKEELWLLYVLIDQPDMASSYDVDIAFDAVKHYVKDYIDSQQKVDDGLKKAIEQNREIREIVNHRWASGVNNNALCTVKHIREVIEE